MSGKVVRGGDEKLNPESHFFYFFSPKPVNQLVLVLKPAKVPKLFPCLGGRDAGKEKRFGRTLGY